MAGYGRYPENFYSQDPPPNWQQGPASAPYQPAPQHYSAPYPQGDGPWGQQQQQYGPPAPYSQPQRYSPPMNEYGTYPPPQPEARGYDEQSRAFGLGGGQGGEGGERGLKASLAGAAAGGFLGHEMKGGAVADIGGAIIGAIAANAFEKHHEKKKAEKKARHAYDDGYVNGESRDLGYGDDYESSESVKDEYYEDRPRHHHHHHHDDYNGDRYDDYQEKASFRQEDFYDNRRY